MMSTDAAGPTSQPLADQIHDELRGRTSPEEAITSAELSEKLQIGDGEASPKTRELIKEVMIDRDLPIVASNSGYYVATTTAEMEEYFETLDSRIQGIKSRKQDLAAAFNRRRYGGEN
ncbi:hypothetical protein C437_15316 [Haloarcula vallismortis ATCC 29715]|uniref:Uncharacterized protein n=2 Tax=Haloarcula vallismortis TaxID=28442 RepID=M0IYI8_HALVA|nr:hypothetical protein C437_15316 [Haloarcula vallismortis ATCC 29715]